MSLRETFQKAAQTAFNAAGNVPVEVRYDSYVTATSNISTGAVEARHERYLVSVIFEAYSDRLVDGVKVMSGDKKVMIPALNLPASPTTRDQIQVLENGIWKKHTVKDSDIDPAGALWVLQMRRAQ